MYTWTQFSSPYVGKSHDDCAEILHEAPKYAAVNRNLSAVLDAQTIVDGSVLMCDVEGLEETGEDIDTVRVKAYLAASILDSLIHKTIDSPQRNAAAYGGVLTMFAGRDANKE